MEVSSVMGITPSHHKPSSPHGWAWWRLGIPHDLRTPQQGGPSFSFLSLFINPPQSVESKTIIHHRLNSGLTTYRWLIYHPHPSSKHPPPSAARIPPAPPRPVALRRPPRCPRRWGPRRRWRWRGGRAARSARCRRPPRRSRQPPGNGARHLRCPRHWIRPSIA